MTILTLEDPSQSLPQSMMLLIELAETGCYQTLIGQFNKSPPNINCVMFSLRKKILRHAVRARLSSLSVPSGVSQVVTLGGDKVDTK